jgi:8-oxo-dGTP pyrophosphatase MutT (NUDIX family)
MRWCFPAVLSIPPILQPLSPRHCGQRWRHDCSAASPELAHALGVAACRELTEEVGLSLGDPPRLDQLSYLCRAITPADHPIRFNARFFVVSASALTGTPVASRELEAPTWYDIEAALVAGAVFVTQAVLMRLRQWVATPGAADWAVPVLRERAWTDE